jgi:hypothetical protein
MHLFLSACDAGWAAPVSKRRYQPRPAQELQGPDFGVVDNESVTRIPVADEADDATLAHWGVLHPAVVAVDGEGVHGSNHGGTL